MSNATSYWLTNVRLEERYKLEEGIIRQTETGLYHLQIQEGTIAAIVPADSLPMDDLPRQDAKGNLLLPAFRDMHIHTDKTYYSDPWKAVRPPYTIFARVEEEATLLIELLPKAQQRAEAMIELLFRHGTTH